MKIQKTYIRGLDQYDWNNVSTECKISVCNYHIELHNQLEELCGDDLAIIQEILENKKIPSAGKIQEICESDIEMFAEYVRRMNTRRITYADQPRLYELSEDDSKVYELLLESSKRLLAGYEKKKKEAESRKKNLRKALEHFEFILENAVLLEARCKAKLVKSAKDRELHEAELHDLKLEVKKEEEDHTIRMGEEAIKEAERLTGRTFEKIGANRTEHEERLRESGE